MRVTTFRSSFIKISVLGFFISCGHGLDNVLAADKNFVADNQTQVSKASGQLIPAAVYCRELDYEYKTIDGRNCRNVISSFSKALNLRSGIIYRASAD